MGKYIKRQFLVLFGILLVVSILIGPNLVVRFVIPQELTSLQLPLFIAGSIVIVFALSYFIGYRFAWPYLKKSSWDVKRIAFIAAGLGGIIIGLYYTTPTIILEKHQVEIVSIRNADVEEPSEIRFFGIPFGDIQISEGEWTYGFMNNVWILNQGDGRKVWEVYTSAEPAISVRNHPDQNEVQVYWDGKAVENIPIDFGKNLLEVDYYSNAPKFYSSINTFLRVGDFTIYAFLLFLLLCITMGKRPDNFVLESRWWILGYAIPMILVWGLYLLAFWPGVTIPDSVAQWTQAHDITKLGNSQPLMYTFIIGFIIQIWDSLAAVLLVQILAMAVSAAYGFYVLQKMRVPHFMVGMGVFAMALIPINGFFIIHLMKDIPFAIALLLITAFCLKIYESEGDWLDKKGNLLALSLVMMLTFTRQNGIHEVTMIFFGILVLYRKKWKQISLAMLVVMLGFTAYNAVVDMVDLEPDSHNAVKLILWHQLAYYVINEKGLTSEELEEFHQMFPDDNIVYYCSNGTKSWEESYGAGRVGKSQHLRMVDRNRLINLYVKSTLRQPWLALEHVICRSEILWSVALPEETTARIRIRSPYNHSAPRDKLRHDSKLPLLEIKLYDDLATTTWKDLENIPTWLAPGLYFNIFIVGFLIRGIFNEKKFAFLVIGLPVFAHFAFWAFVLEWPKLQYIYPIIPSMLVLLPLLYSGGNVKIASLAHKLRNIKERK